MREIVVSYSAPSPLLERKMKEIAKTWCLSTKASKLAQNYILRQWREGRIALILSKEDIIDINLRYGGE